jgi:hypothetical protein
LWSLAEGSRESVSLNVLNVACAHTTNDNVLTFQ